MINQNKIFSFKIKRQAKKNFPNDVERTVDTYLHVCCAYSRTMEQWKFVLEWVVRAHEG